ncbi:hypothetical protein VNO77_29402 [Canavalia gladiata]|uniref:Uncharacterized protein n=1 Tax=Canavalia gladiata TaxID=3824 RepID=A0AAN9KZV3_CANGL
MMRLLSAWMTFAALLICCMFDLLNIVALCGILMSFSVQLLVLLHIVLSLKLNIHLVAIYSMSPVTREPKTLMTHDHRGDSAPIRRDLQQRADEQTTQMFQTPHPTQNFKASSFIGKRPKPGPGGEATLCELLKKEKHLFPKDLSLVLPM